MCVRPSARIPDSIVTKTPLALPGEGFHRVRVRLPLAITLCLALAAPAAAQISSLDELLDGLRAESETQVPRDPERDGVPPDAQVLPPPDIPPDTPRVAPPPLEDEEGADSDAPPLPNLSEAELDAPDYSRLSSDAERTARLDDMFARLKDAESSKAAELIAEEIWSVWTRSGSASVDFTLRRAAAAQASGQTAKARALFDTVTHLQPDFAEGWARSARLALDEGDVARALGDAGRALQREPRHYYALWTMGSVLERMGRTEPALEAYREALALYPELELVKARAKALELQVDGGVL